MFFKPTGNSKGHPWWRQRFARSRDAILEVWDALVAWAILVVGSPVRSTKVKFGWRTTIDRIWNAIKNVGAVVVAGGFMLFALLDVGGRIGRKIIGCLPG